VRPRTQYADSGGCSIAYQVIGDGPVDLFFLQGLLSHLDMQWCDPIFSAFLYRIANCCRLIVMDQRGVGLSDGSGTSRRLMSAPATWPRWLTRWEPTGCS
jgi:pimeloyl-ACP methyl ester carboxylesterase